MSYNTGPKIVTDGLVLCLDAADRNSYAGSGTIWYDLSGNSNNASLVNGMVYETTNGGGLVMDGGDEYLDVPYNSSTFDHFSTGDFTVETFVRSDNVVYPRSRHPIKLGHTVYSGKKGWSVGHRDSSSSIEIRASNGSSSSVVTINHSEIAESTYYHRAFSVSRSNGISTACYLNASLIGTASSTGLTGSIYDGSQTSEFGSSGLVIGYVWGWRYIGSINIVRVYNYALSASEVLRNYNATKCRFGL